MVHEPRTAQITLKTRKRKTEGFLEEAALGLGSSYIQQEGPRLTTLL